MTQTALYPLTIYLCRHAETAWSLSGQHTGRTDIPLTDNGRQQALTLQYRLESVPFHLVLTSPLQRAKESCEIAFPGKPTIEEADLMEWDYGDYEGLTSASIRQQNPSWNLFHDGGPNGETPAHAAARADRILKKLRDKQGNIAIFSHGHFSRVLAARWLNLSVEHASSLFLSVCSVSILGFEHQRPVIRLWNDVGHL